MKSTILMRQQSSVVSLQFHQVAWVSLMSCVSVTLQCFYSIYNTMTIRFEKGSNSAVLMTIATGSLHMICLFSQCTVALRGLNAKNTAGWWACGLCGWPQTERGRRMVEVEVEGGRHKGDFKPIENRWDQKHFALSPHSWSTMPMLMRNGSGTRGGDGMGPSC